MQTTLQLDVWTSQQSFIWKWKTPSLASFRVFDPRAKWGRGSSWRAHFSAVRKPISTLLIINCPLRKFRYLNPFSHESQVREKTRFSLEKSFWRRINGQSHVTPPHKFTFRQTRGVDLSNKPRTKTVRPSILAAACLAYFVTYIHYTRMEGHVALPRPQSGVKSQNVPNVKKWVSTNYCRLVIDRSCLKLG